ncbi:sodium/proline symporter, partial [Candidatus Sumerlaeota bacterium]|nr:sodium/proline symporter [Candidatus Sumerlaeota bacterium]
MNTTVILVSFSLYTLVIVAVGLWSAVYARRSDEDYFLAGRSLGPWVAALSASASSESGWVTLGLVGWAFTYGVQAHWIIPGCLLGFLFNWFFIAGRMSRRSRELGAVTLPDFFAFHFRERTPLLRALSVLVILVAMFLYVSAQFAAAGKAFEASFPGVDYRVGVLIGAAVVLVYTVTGGFRAVCWTDFLQALLMVGTLVIFPVALLITRGGFGPLGQALGGAEGDLLRFWPAFSPEEGGVAAMIGFLLGSGALGINLGYPGQPHVLVRFMALEDPKSARIGGIISAIWAALIYWGAVTIGLFARAMAETGVDWTEGMDGELGLVLSAMHLLPGVLSGLILAAVLAAICSTADSQLVVAASSGANDLYARIVERSTRTSHFLINRLVLLALGLAAVAMVINREVQVYTYVLTYGWAVLGASFGPQVALALLWRRATYAGCVAGMFTGFAVALLWAIPMVGVMVDGVPQTVSLGKSLQISAGIEVYNLTLGFV